jgi:predicted transglutaminase-like cysteine proteinase
MEGDYILDNLDDRVRLWSETQYRFMKRQADFDAGRWVKIENSTDVLVGAVEK